MKLNASRFGLGEIDLHARNNQFETESLKSVFQSIVDNPLTKIRKTPLFDHGHPVGDFYTFSINGLSKEFNLLPTKLCFGGDTAVAEHYIEDFVKAACAHLNIPLPDAKSKQLSSQAGTGTGAYSAAQVMNQNRAIGTGTSTHNGSTNSSSSQPTNSEVAKNDEPPKCTIS